MKLPISGSHSYIHVYILCSISILPHRPQSAKKLSPAQPSQLEMGRISPLFLSPLKTPPLFSLSPEAPDAETKSTSNTIPSDSSPDFSLSTSKTPIPANVLRSRTNVKGTGKETTPVVKVTTAKDSPAVGMVCCFSIEGLSA